MLNAMPAHEELYAAIVRRDPDLDGVVYVGVKTTGVFCRPVCPARTPLSKNIVFFACPEDAQSAGFRACKRCRPLDDPDAPSAMLDTLLALVETDPSRRWSEEDLRGMGVEPATARRQFQKRFDMSFSQYARARRLGHAFHTLRKGDSVIEAQLDAGFDSSSGFRDAFSRQFGDAPNKSREARAFAIDWIDTPLGPMFAIADDTHLHMLEFAERKKLETHVDRYRKPFNAAVLPGETEALKRIRRELKDYFAGKTLCFTSEIAGAGTPFQQQVWDELRRIPPGVTRSYQEVSQRIGRPTAMRAVANANRLNRCAIILPCHRVIGADGTLTGYAGGLWRKQWLLDHERRVTGQTLV
ncbi:MAG: trifunctional transcriptional activator/DNA repair protein Ada/methylated-DNA--[protein]-cysteine S-methyltransferase [Alphaproteobacteria bacterium]|nr:trifunctional transcriptional activator/DNA repair protein Ada/methylated-DNA--[protein]-cysteine S-methyltransferase [Alphaproteobacteria bacterium]